MKESPGFTLDAMAVRDATRMACDWLVDVAQIQTTHLTAEDPWHFRYASWKGAIRGEYSAASRRWGFFAPVWHTGQAVKALLLAARHLGQPRYRAAARLGADFILDKQVWQPGHPNHGLILAFEDYGDKVVTAGVLECMDGLLLLASDVTPASPLADLEARMIQAGRFLIDRLYLPGQGVFRDVFDPATGSAVFPSVFRVPPGQGGRPLLDDAIWCKLYELSGDRRFLDVQVAVSDTLVADQRPPGNWVDYGPCDPDTMRFHPRHTYWWGRSLLESYRVTHRREYFDTALASGHFMRRALRHDGGCFRGTYCDDATGILTTDSFGHATSGSACAAIFFMELHAATADAAWLEAAEQALGFCASMQLHSPKDPNLQGVIVEKIRAPDGTDALPYHIRDLGTIFFIQAAVKYLALQDAAASPATAVPTVAGESN
ncbi:MAG: hypothetical protein WD042_19780 [Phycisphaeraceae bacterium]